ncbi:MAG: insulinase family protein [bacterium]|nr:MAG: insulinase family protein [bacterium]
MKRNFQFLNTLDQEPEEQQIVGIQLNNGLQVVMLKNQRTPIVAVDLWYKVGSKDEQPGKSGFAHLFEHMMFEGSQNVGKAEHMKLINDVGGMVNGSTTQDRTNYWEIVPANQLELALWLEADRMQSLHVTRENFDNQRATVKEERRLRIDNQPYMRVLYELKDEIAYSNFAYKHSVIGSMEDLDRATLQDVRDFHDLYYRPNNAVLTLVGDFQMCHAAELIQKYFSPIPAGQSIPPVNLTEPPGKQEIRFNYEDQFAPFPAISVAFKIPERTHPDYYALEILEKILFDGESSRFYSRLVEEDQVALHVFGGQDGKFGPGLFFIFAQLHPQKHFSDLENTILQEFEKIGQDAISKQELVKAQNKIRHDFISQQESVRSLADLLCFYTTLSGNPEQLYREMSRFEKVTVDDLQRVARKYFSATNRSIIEIYPRKES